MKQLYVMAFLIIITLTYACKSEKTTTTTTKKETETIDKSETTANNTLICSKERLTYENNIKPILANYCVGCHNDNRPAAGIALTNYPRVKEVADKGVLNCVLDGVDCRMMPPKGNLTDKEKNLILCWIRNGSPEK